MSPKTIVPVEDYQESVSRKDEGGKKKRESFKGEASDEGILMDSDEPKTKAAEGYVTGGGLVDEDDGK